LSLFERRRDGRRRDGRQARRSKLPTSEKAQA
jgi:hypothetical protein